MSITEFQHDCLAIVDSADPTPVHATSAHRVKSFDVGAHALMLHGGIFTRRVVRIYRLSIIVLGDFTITQDQVTRGSFEFL